MNHVRNGYFKQKEKPTEQRRLWGGKDQIECEFAWMASIVGLASHLGKLATGDSLAWQHCFVAIFLKTHNYGEKINSSVESIQFKASKGLRFGYGWPNRKAEPFTHTDIVDVQLNVRIFQRNRIRSGITKRCTRFGECYIASCGVRRHRIRFCLRSKTKMKKWNNVDY